MHSEIHLQECLAFHTSAFYISLIVLNNCIFILSKKSTPTAILVRHEEAQNMARKINRNFPTLENGLRDGDTIL